MPTYTYEFGGREIDMGDHGLEIVDTESFEYEPSNKEIEDALKDIVGDDYDVDNLEDFIEANFDELCDEYEDYLKDHFEDAALEEYKDSVDYRRNPDAYYGVSRND